MLCCGEETCEGNALRRKRCCVEEEIGLCEDRSAAEKCLNKEGLKEGNGYLGHFYRNEGVEKLDLVTLAMAVRLRPAPGPLFLAHGWREKPMASWLHLTDDQPSFAVLGGSTSRVKALRSSNQNNGKELWRRFFSDPLQRWDHRSDKVSLGHQEFMRKKKTEMVLWIGRWSPSWVKAELASMEPRDVPRSRHSWNTLLAGHVKCRRRQEAIEAFKQMKLEGVPPDTFTFVRVLNACAGLGALEEGRRIHAQIFQTGCESDVYVGSSLVDMYSKCGSVDDAWNVFQRMPTRNVVSWTSMLTGFVKCGETQKALKLFRQMQAKRVQPNGITFVAVLNACASQGALEEGRGLHAQAIQCGYESNAFVASALVDMYTKCASIDDAWKVFDSVPSHDVVSWTAMLAGFVKCEEWQKALGLFRRMQAEGVKPDHFTFVPVLNACACLAFLEEGRRVHAQLVRSGCKIDLFVGNALVDMYAKCGSIDEAWTVFHSMRNRDVTSWNAMLGGLAVHGRGNEAVRLFQEMNKQGVGSDFVTFVSLLSACSHGGLVEQGLRLFESMYPIYGIAPTVEHYTCIVDLLGRAGRLDEAEDLVRREPKVAEDKVVLTALLGACRNHGNVQMGERIAQRLLQVEPDNKSAFSLLSHIYGAAGRWDSRNKLYGTLKDRWWDGPSLENLSVTFQTISSARLVRN